ncbi:hypothetical protein Nepgr_017288 [Nepenthes gracilis]|uniref:Protein kinase domain-containing protein n=1 Tax=Nepenthes gracilis TaxID=150966 RepID=A0AAD3XS12_NEPGR|nr:hypothetical protein Nepgr_017288 [Nepenthes gracilis]
MKKKLLLNLLALLALVPIFVRSLTPSFNDDVLGLIVFKADVQDPHGKLASWNEDEDSACNWFGVKCSPRSNRVTELVLDDFSLTGRIGRGLLQLQFLRRLSLARNNLTGTIPAALFSLPNLRILDMSNNHLSGTLADDFFQQCGPLRAISLANNRFSGQIPKSLSSCSRLTLANFSSNHISGSLPAEIWSLRGLRSFDISNNLLDGEISNGIQGLYNLRMIDLSRNQFTGTIPNDIGGCSLIKLLDFSENSLSGVLPDSMSNLSFCSYLNLRKNLFLGQVPLWIGALRSLKTLDLSANNFSGIIPVSVGNLHSLKTLNLSMNAFSGSMPDSMTNCTILEVIDLKHNLLTGDLPQWIFKLGLQEVLSEDRIVGSMNSSFYASEFVSYHSLQVLDLSENSLSGEMPSSIGHLSSLQLLNLSRNSIIGSVPRDIAELKALYSLDLSHNHLNGSIPFEVGGATSLRELVLKNNFITGNLPTSIQHCSSLAILILSRNFLNGPIPAAISKLSNLQIVDVSFNNLTGTLPKQLADLPHLLSFNISHNDLQGELPAGGFFNTISPLSVAGNPSLCGSAVNRSCPAVLPKPIVLDPNSTSDSTSASLPPNVITHKKIILSISALIAISAAAVIVIGVVSITVLNLRVRAYGSRSAAALASSGGNDLSSSATTDANSGKLIMFSGEPDFSTGAHALLNKDSEVGRGGFGTVYRTVLRDGRPVAIKKLAVSSLVKSQEDFEREVKKMGKIRHPNLVALEGYYWTQSLQLLIFEFVSGGSLYKYLHGGSGGKSLSWNDRFKIILGMAKGMAHLHQVNVIHYNLKSSNILIDSSGEAKVGDYGLARLLPMLDRYVLSSKIQSALGYMAPEFACKTVKITEKCDVYGFGVLVLELVTGKRPVEYMEDDVVVLCDMVRGALDGCRVEECVDKRLLGNFPAEEAAPVMKLGLICTSQVPSNRPDMREVVSILEMIRCPSLEGQEDSS